MKNTIRSVQLEHNGSSKLQEIKLPALKDRGYKDIQLTFHIRRAGTTEEIVEVLLLPYKVYQALGRDLHLDLVTGKQARISHRQLYDAIREYVNRYEIELSETIPF